MSKRRNPKKDRTARRRRAGSDGLAELRPVRWEPELVGLAMSGASPASVPLMGAASVWLARAAQAKGSAAGCVGACLVVREALAVFGITSHVQAVGVEVETPDGRRTMYGHPEGPRHNADGTFDGHTVLMVTGAHRLLDPTVQQFRGVPRRADTARPVIAEIGQLGDLASCAAGTQLRIIRSDHVITYMLLKPQERQAWRIPAVDAAAGKFREQGEDVAAIVLELTRRLDGERACPPYPRMRRQLAAVDGMTLADDPVQGCYFSDRMTGRQIRLTDVK
jgi:hypothetical protein